MSQGRCIGTFAESSAIDNVIFKLGEGPIECFDAGGLKDGGEMLKVIIRKRMVFVVSDCNDGISNGREEFGDFKDILSFVEVFDVITEDST